MSLTKQFATDKTKEQNGIRFVVGLNDEGKEIAFTLSRLSKTNKKYAAVFEAKTKPYRRQIQAGTLSNEIAEKISREVFAYSILLGWENVTVEDVTGQEGATNLIDFSPTNAISLFENLPDLFEMLQAEANNAGSFRADVLEAEAKN